MSASSTFSVDSEMFQALLKHLEARDARRDEMDLRFEAARTKSREEMMGHLAPILPMLILYVSRLFGQDGDKKLPGDDHLELALLVKRLTISMEAERFGQVVKLLKPEEQVLLVEILRLLERVPCPYPPSPEPPMPFEFRYGPPQDPAPPATPEPPKPRASKTRRSKK